MKNKCNIVRDLLPLYVENMASEDTMSFVKEHLKECSSCRKECKAMRAPSVGISFGGKQDAKRELKRVAKDISNRIKIACLIPMMFMLIFGLGLSVGFEPIANFVLMPLVGILGYFVFYWKSIFVLPLIVWTTSGIMNFFHWAMGTEYMEAINFLAVSGIYLVFILVGVLISALLHYAFQKEDK